MRGLHIGAIRKADKDAIRVGGFVGVERVCAKEMAGAAGVRNGSGLGGGN